MTEIEKKPPENHNEEKEGTLPENIEELKALLTKEQEKAENYLANWQRATADLINYRKRVKQEKAESGNIAASLLFSKILPVLDDLERALSYNPDDGIHYESLLEGIKNIQRKFSSILESEGMTEIKSVGEVFDPSLHEAVMQGDGEPGKVIAEVRKGYKFNDRVLRPTMVVVGKEREEKDTKVD